MGGTIGDPMAEEPLIELFGKIAADLAVAAETQKQNAELLRDISEQFTNGFPEKIVDRITARIKLFMAASLGVVAGMIALLEFWR